MSLGFYGGFPGPPDNNEQQSESNEVNQNIQSNLNPSASIFNHDVGFYPASNHSGLRYPGPQFNSHHLQTNAFYYEQPYFNQVYEQPYLQGNLPAFAPPNMNQGTSPFYPNTTINPQSQAQMLFEQNDNISSANGKSRRFSRQRTNNNPVSNISSLGAKVGGKEEDKGSSSSMNEQQNRPIRFSHQRETKKVHSEKKKSKSQNSSKTKKEESEKLSNDMKDLNLKEGKKSKKKTTKLPKHDGNQASLLLEQLTDGTYECMVCCDPIKQSQAVWNCPTCYNLFHMGCIKKWARSPAAKIEGAGWRCPGCQNVSQKVPSSYLCFCGQQRDPLWRKGEMPHSCGEVCGKQRKENKDCNHPCNILCHPGPCPHCPAMINKKCRCLKTTSRVRCSQQNALKCNQPCGKLLNCGVHVCEEVCHTGRCESCIVSLDQVCFCTKNKRTIICGSEDHKYSTKTEDNIGSYSCANVCDKLLNCGIHNCEQNCHSGDCSTCSLLPQVVDCCPCGKTKLVDIYLSNSEAVKREKCSDPIPTCEKICEKELSCGGDEKHFCSLPCHSGVCNPCKDKESVVICRCGKSDKEVSCGEYVAMKSYICDRRCNKKRKCGRHKCGQTCCTNTEHLCTQICGRKLTCGKHRCDDTCHRGTCHTCYDVSFDELRCYCEDKVIYPPVQCGTRPPECGRECTRLHSCNHQIRHTCHTEEHCPPCVELVKKPCNCGKQTRGSIMCHIDNVSCGAPCNKTLACGHKCLKICHKGQCLEENEKCQQPCSIMRSECIHPCSNPCHQSESCPNSKCRAMVTLRCSCGLREKQTECSNSSNYDNTLMLRSKNQIDIGKFLRPGTNKGVLPCTEECSVAERNKRLAEALDIKDPDERNKHVYSEFLLNIAKSDPAFIRTIEKEMLNLVESVKWMGLNKQTHSFPSMKKDKRQVIHELATAYNCKSDSHDVEPNRNVIVTATKGVATVPQPLLSDVIMKEVTSLAGGKLGSEKKPKGRLLSSIRLVSYSSSGSSPPGKPPSTTKTSFNQKTTPSSTPVTSSSHLSDSQPTSSLSPLAKNFKMRPSVTQNDVPDSGSRKLSMEKGNLATASHNKKSVVKEKAEDNEIDYFDMTE